MALLLILIVFYFDYKPKKDTFLSDLKGGLFVFGVFILYAIILHHVFKIGLLYIIFSIGIELILIFVLKGFFNNNAN